MRHLVMIVGIVLVAIVIVSLIRVSDFENTSSKIYDRCTALKIGMSRDKVKSLIGEPKQKFVEKNENSDLFDTWYFGVDPSGSSTMTVSFNAKTGLLVGLVCGENFFVGIDNKSIEKFGYEPLIMIDNRIRAITMGQSADSVLKLLGEPERAFTHFGTVTWQYPGLLQGDGRPTIELDSATNRVTNTVSSIPFFVSEDIAYQIVVPKLSMK